MGKGFVARNMVGLTRNVSPARVYRALELLLLLLVAVQAARFFWAIVTPAGPLGDVRPAVIASGPSADFDPFFRVSSEPGSVVVTSLALKLYGVRVDEAMGRGSAIIATPDGVQSSVGVGEEIMPGVTLKAVAFDSVTIDRGGVSEQLFLDQSVAAPTAAPQASPAAPSSASPAPAPSGPSSFGNEISYAPRTVDGKINGIIVNPRGSGQMMQAIGLQPGDVVTAINGLPVTSIETISSHISGGDVATLQIERAGRTLTISPGSGKK